MSNQQIYCFCKNSIDVDGILVKTWGKFNYQNYDDTDLIKEANILLRFKNPYISKLLARVESPWTTIQTEYCNGGNLEQYLMYSYKGTPREAMKIIDHISNAISSLHRSSIMHRRIEPTHILLHYEKWSFCTKLCGFRLAVSTLTKTDNLPISSDRYIAPETKSKNRYELKSDVYCLGLVVEDLCLYNRMPKPSWLSTLLEQDPRKRSTIDEAIDRKRINKNETNRVTSQAVGACPWITYASNDIPSAQSEYTLYSINENDETDTSDLEEIYYGALSPKELLPSDLFDDLEL
jgi:serine/threonine protein kinase